VHNPGLKKWVSVCKANRDSYIGHIPREALLFPHLNLEDLSWPKNLLLLINSRGRNHPEAFVSDDACVLPFASNCRAVETTWLPGYEITFNQSITGSYAVFKAEEDVEKTAVELHEGIAVLEIQEKILDFLLTVCHLVLHEVNLSSPLTLLAQPEPPSLLTHFNQMTGEHPSLSAIASDAAYRVPTTTSFGLLMTLVQARLDAAKDHAWELRQDPGYFLEAVKLSDDHSTTHKRLWSDGKNSWSQAIHNTVYNFCLQVIHWNEILNWLELVMEFREEYHDILVSTSSEDWPEKYTVALLLLSEKLTEASSQFREILKEAVYSSPPLRHLFHKASWAPHSSGLIRNQPVDHKDYLIRLLGLLTREGMDDVMEMHQVLEDIGQILATDHVQRARITSYVSELLENIEVLEEMSRQVRQHHRKLYYPWCLFGKYGPDSAAIDRFRTMKPVGNLITLLSISITLQKLDYSKYAPINDRYYYPAEKRRTESHVSQMQKAERYLDEFWNEIDAQVKKELGGSFKELIPALDFSDRILQRTSDWIPVALNISTKIDVVFDEIPGFRENHEPTSSSKIALPTPKIKLKTRGTNSDESLFVPKESRENGQLEKRQIHKLKPRDLKVFRTLFHQPSQKNATAVGQVKWLDFVHAMASIGTGFTYQKLGGSAWQFTPTPELGLQRGFSCHKPHPDNKLSFWQARHVGRRLQRAYGWDKDTFVAE
jgi:hypothetical protein